MTSPKTPSLESKSEDDLDLITAREIDRVICEWSMQFGIALTEVQLNELVDKICEVVGIDVTESMI